MTEYAEYYFTGNPPLLPDGVASVIAHAREEFYPEKLAEILYEPEAPWFKIIGLIDHQSEVLAMLESCLERMFDDQVALVDDDDNDDDENTEGEETNCETRCRADVELVTETPQVIPWLKYLGGNRPMNDQYDEHRFPESLNDFPFKAIWRDLELTNGLTISELLSRYSFLSPRAHPPTVQDLGKSTRCEITHNMRGDTIYIGSKIGPECLAAASQRLENLLGLHKPNIAPSSHLVFPESAGPTKLCIRWLTHVGLDKLTYTKSPLLGDVAESEPLTHAATVRIEATYEIGYKVEENTTYKAVGNRSENFSSSFDPFVNLEYPLKCPGTLPIPKVNRPLSDSSSQFSESPALDTAGDLSEEGDDSLRELACANFDLGDNHLFPSISDKGKLVATHDRQNDQTMPANVDAPALDEKSAATSKTESLHGSVNILQTSMTSADVVTNWMAGIEAAQASEYTMPGLPLSPSFVASESLPDLATHAPSALRVCIDGDAVPQLANLIPIESIKRPSTPNMEICDNTVCLLDSESPIKYNYGMFAALDPTSNEKIQTSHSNPPLHKSKKVDEGNLMDSWEAPIPSYPALMDITVSGSDRESACVPNTSIAGIARQADSTPVFNKRDDVKHEFFVTMNQKTGVSDVYASILSRPRAENMERGNSKSAESHHQLEEKRGPRKQVPMTQSTGAEKSVHEFAKSQHVSLKSPGLPTVAVDLINAKRKLVPGMDVEPTQPSRRALRSPEGMTRCIKDVERQVKEVLNVLQVVPGAIKIEARLGRLCIKGVGDSFVNVGNGPSWRHGEILEVLSHPEVGAEFHTILTTNGTEAGSVPNMVLSKGEPWKLYQKELYYDFVCGTKDNDDPIVVEVNASTFAYDCKPLCQDLPGVYIHCPRRAWDVQLSVTRCSYDAIPGDFGPYAKALVKSLGVGFLGEEHVQIEAGKDIVSRWHIKEAKVRHVAQYRNTPKSPTYLCISMTRAVKRQAKPNYQGTTTPAPVPGQGPMTQWFEAWFGSKKADRYTRQNEALKFGEKTSWTPEQLVNEGVIKGICEPALRMATQIDHIGQTNYNGQGPQIGRKVSRAQTTFNKDEPFW